MDHRQSAVGAKTVSIAVLAGDTYFRGSKLLRHCYSCKDERVLSETIDSRYMYAGFSVLPVAPARKIALLGCLRLPAVKFLLPSDMTRQARRTVLGDPDPALVTSELNTREI